MPLHTAFKPAWYLRKKIPIEGFQDIAKSFLSASYISSLILISMLALAVACSQKESAESTGSQAVIGNSFIIDNARALTPTGILSPASIRVEGGLITGIVQGESSHSDLPVINIQGQTVTAGLIDAHTHSFDKTALKDSLRFGVTIELDMFTDVAFFGRHKAQRSSLQRTDLADLYSAGTLVTSSGGHGTQFGMSIPTISAPDQAAEFVQARIAEGSDWIKIVYEPNNGFFESVDRPTMAAVIKAAHANGVKALVHVSKLSAAREAVSAGVDGLVHVFADQVIDDELIASMKERGVFVIPTLSVIGSYAAQSEAEVRVKEGDFLEFMSKSQKSTLKANFGLNPALDNLFKLDIAYKNLSKLKAAGIPILIGTDAPNPGTAHGVSVHEELSHFVKAGWTPTEALYAATKLPSEIFQLKDRGVLALGARADLVIYDGKPDERISDSRKISKIFKNGYEIERSPVPNTNAEAPSPPWSPTGLSNFDEDLSSSVDIGWTETTDEIAGGTSTLYLSHEREGDNGFLRARGKVTTKFFFPWSGTSLFFGNPEPPGQNWSELNELRFRARGDARKITVMFFTRESPQRPATETIKVNGDWQTFSVNLANVKGASMDEVYGIAFTASRPKGEFTLDIDDVMLE